MAVETEQVRVEVKVLNRLRKHVAGTKVSIQEFVTGLIKKEMDRVDAKKK